jgi:hypothetical protein
MIIGSHLDEGRWVPPAYPSCEGSKCTWKTEGTGLFGGDERGYVTVDYVYHTKFIVKMFFDNPLKGTNRCAIEGGGAKVSCSITQGSFATLNYHIGPP